MYTRLSLTRPRAERSEDLRKAHEELLRTYRTMPGFVRGYLMTALDDTGRICRLSVWNGASDADRAAQQQHVLALRSEMARMIDDESDIHLEQAFDAVEV